MLYSKTEILESLANQFVEHNLQSGIIINKIVIDSRKASKNTLFICIKGENNDGHDFIEQALKKGCQAILIHEKELLKKHQNLILVKNTFDAFYEIAKYARKRSEAKIIAITGSMGKSSTKEIIKITLSSQGKTYATSGNLNNHFGVPLTICNMPKNTEFGIVEMGMNHLGEISQLTKLAKPHIAIITGITSAHIGNFKDESEIAQAKSEIFESLDEKGIAIINRDNIHFDFLKKQALKNTKNIISFGFDKKSDYCLNDLKIKDINLSEVAVKTTKHDIFYQISSSQKSIIINSVMAIICLEILAKNFNEGLKSFLKINAIKGRGNVFEIKINDKNITIIDDSYNANLASMKAGIDYLCDLKNVLQKKHSIAIIGDVFELGEKSSAIHEEILKYASKIDFIITAGSQTKKASINLKNCQNFENSQEIAKIIADFINEGDIILIKGSRSMKMEEVFKNFTTY
jgi:UDP-N-acetylmuramoyl-tripeptide--D-alanyl-D-alanine ligase